MNSRSKQIEAQRRAYDTTRRQIIKEFGLTPDEVTRLSTLDVRDPISDYAGNMLVQASLLVADRTVIPDNIILGEE